MAELLIKAGTSDGGDIINVGFNSEKSEIKMKIHKKKDPGEEKKDEDPDE
jgi:hypothetical protein